jgi:hypothetical protein
VDDVRRAVSALTAVLVIVTLAQILAVEANPFMFGPHLGITSPQQFKKNNYQTIYQTTTIPIQIQINTPLDYPKIVKVYYILDLNYSLDNNPQKALTISSPQTSTYSGAGSTLYLATGTLENLSNGTHWIDVWALNAEGETPKSGTITFQVNATSIAKSEQPLISNLTIALVISTNAIVIGASLAVLAYERRNKVSDG